jgi:hypothetical protein
VAAAVAALLLVVVLVLLLTGNGGHGRAGGRVPTTTTTPASPPPPAVNLPAHPAPSGAFFGVNVNDLFNLGTFTPTQIAAQLAAVRATGATVVRSDALWEASEPTAPVGGVHHWSWSFDDRIAAATATAHLQWLPIIDYTAPWAESIPGQDHSPPRAESDFAAYAAAFAARYGTGGAFWRAHPELSAEPVDTLEIWNEPDNAEFWRPAPSASAYAALYAEARAAVDAVDSSARVIIGGITHPEAFLPALLAARPSLRGHVDGVAVHPYGGNPFVILGRVQGARHTLDQLGMATVPVYVTEFGWATHPAGVFAYLNSRLRPGYITATLSALGHTDCEIAGVELYTWVTPERDLTNKEDWYGIAPPGGGTTADTTAFAAGLTAATGPGPTVRLCSG